MAAALGVLTVVATIAILVGLSAATDHTVGNPGSGWVQGNNFTEWAQGQTFSQGDDLSKFSLPVLFNLMGKD